MAIGSPLQILMSVVMASMVAMTMHIVSIPHLVTSVNVSWASQEMEPLVKVSF